MPSSLLSFHVGSCKRSAPSCQRLPSLCLARQTLLHRRQGLSIPASPVQRACASQRLICIGTSLDRVHGMPHAQFQQLESMPCQRTLFSSCPRWHAKFAPPSMVAWCRSDQAVTTEIVQLKASGLQYISSESSQTKDGWVSCENNLSPRLRTAKRSTVY